MEIFKVLILGVVISLLAVFLKSIKPEYSLICVIVGSVILLFYIVNAMTDIFEFFGDVVNKTGIDKSLFSLLLKIIGIGYLVEFSAGVCMDSGNSSIANKVLVAGKVLIFLLSMPIIQNLFETVLSLLWNFLVIKVLCKKRKNSYF